MAKHRVNWHLHRGKAEHHAGDVVDLDAATAEELLKLGVVTPLEEATPSAPPISETLAPEKLAKLNKTQLAEYAKAKFGKDLDTAALTKDALLAEIATFASGATE
jgi:hypothetical protein